jgi:ParB family transcriptional regulator, chromosome partitioning protein
MTDPTKMASTFCTVRIENIGIPLRKRDVDPGNVERLAESIASVGLLNPLVVRRTGASQSGILTLVAGRHRLEALKRLGREEVECRIITDDDLQAQLMEIDENLCRAELTPAQEAAAVARRKEIYLALHPETAAGRSQAAGMNAKLGRGNVSEKMSPTFTKATAAASKKTPRSLERAAARGDAINLEDLKKIEGTSLDKGTELDALAKMSARRRAELIDRAAKGESVSARTPPTAAKTSPAQPRPSPESLAYPTQEDEEAQFKALEAAWEAASDGVRGRFGVEILHLGSAAWTLPLRPKQLSDGQTAA